MRGAGRALVASRRRAGPVDSAGGADGRRRSPPLVALRRSFAAAASGLQTVDDRGARARPRRRALAGSRSRPARWSSPGRLLLLIGCCAAVAGARPRRPVARAAAAHRPLASRLRSGSSASAGGRRSPSSLPFLPFADRRMVDIGDAGAHLRDARLGPQHRGRPRRAARPRLRRLLCRRRLYLRAAGARFRPVVLGLPAAGRRVRGVLRRCCSASRCCGCAATISPSSPSASARSSASSCSTGTRVTNGPDGISGIPRPTFFGSAFERAPPEGGARRSTSSSASPTQPMQRVIFLYYLILVLALVTNAFVTCASAGCRSAAPGRRCARTRSPAARSASTRPTPSSRPSRSAPCSAASPARSSPRARASSARRASPSSNSAIILAIVVLGGMGSQIGVVLAAILLVGAAGVRFRELQHYRMLAFGARAWSLIMIWRPRGLLAHREPTIRLHEGATAQPAERRAMTPARRAAARGRASDHAVRRPDRDRRPLLRAPSSARSPPSSARTAPARPRCSTA